MQNSIAIAKTPNEYCQLRSGQSLPTMRLYASKTGASTAHQIAVSGDMHN